MMWIEFLFLNSLLLIYYWFTIPKYLRIIESHLSIYVSFTICIARIQVLLTLKMSQAPFPSDKELLLLLFFNLFALVIYIVHMNETICHLLPGLLLSKIKNYLKFHPDSQKPPSIAISSFFSRLLTLNTVFPIFHHKSGLIYTIYEFLRCVQDRSHLFLKSI